MCLGGVKKSEFHEFRDVHFWHHFSSQIIGYRHFSGGHGTVPSPDAPPKLGEFPPPPATSTHAENRDEDGWFATAKRRRRAP